MTTPTGHQDYQAFAQWRGGPILDQAYSVTSVTPLTASLFLGNFASLQIACFANAGQGVVFTVKYFTDQTLAFLIGQHQWKIWQSQVQVVTPVLGPFAVITVSTNNAGANTGTVYVAPVNTPVGKPTYPALGNEFFANALSVPASGTFTHQLGDIVSGTVSVSFDELDINQKLAFQVDQLDDTGNQSAIILPLQSPPPNAAVGAGPEVIQTICREQILRLQVFNSDGAAAHSCTVRIYVQSQ